MVARLYEGMSIREISEYLFCEDELAPADLILLFGGKRLERAERAAELYKAGLAPRIVITGGDKRGTGIAESIRLKEHCVSLGVPEEAIVTECESVNSMENVKMSAALIEKSMGWANLNNVIIISAPYHLRRIKHALARKIPRSVKITCCPDTRTDITRENWWHTQEGQNMVVRELEKVRTYAFQGEL